jgi:hypothetical protein
LASAICVFSSSRLRCTSACAWAGTAGRAVSCGQFTVGTVSAAEATPRPTPARTTATPATAPICQRREFVRDLLYRALYIGAAPSARGTEKWLRPSIRERSHEGLPLKELLRRSFPAARRTAGQTGS